MKLHNPFDWIEILLTGLFVLFYLFYIIRIVKIARSYKVSRGDVITKILIRSTYFALILFAFLGPAFGEGQREVKSIGKDIFIAVDLSQSMNARDVAPSRLEKIKFELKNIVNAFSSDRIGIIIFTSEAFLQSPLTYDKTALLDLSIELLNTNLITSDGTDFGPPLEMALEKLESEETSVTQPKSKIIVLISDGEDFGDDTDQVADKIETSGIKLFTLGIGTEKGGKIPHRTGYKKDRTGNVVTTKLNPRSLKRLANQTDGKYFEINDVQNDVKRLISTIDKIEGELRDAKTLDVSTNKYNYFLWGALALICLDVLLSLRVVKLT
ncbi:MAG: VWA domain-containing protein [Cyclobacteriaceae bacterium]